MLYDSQQLFLKPCFINLGDYPSTTPNAEDYLSDITSIIPVADDPGFIIWLPMTATGPKHHGDSLH
jgi:hypothetical protein